MFGSPTKINISVHALRNVPKSVDFHQADGRYSSASSTTHHLGFSIPRRLAGINTCSEFHVHMHGFSDPAKLSQGPIGTSRDFNADYQIHSVMQTSIDTNFPFSFGQTQCSSKFCFPRQTYVPCKCVFCLPGNHSFTSLPSYHHQRYDLISFTMVDEWHFYPPPRSQHISLYGRQSLWMGSLFRADETILSWPLDGRPIPAPYQHVRNDGYTLSTETSHNIYSTFLFHDIHRQHDSGLIYQQAGWNSFFQSLRRGMRDSQFLPRTRHRNQSSSYPRQI